MAAARGQRYQKGQVALCDALLSAAGVYVAKVVGRRPTAHGLAFRVSSATSATPFARQTAFLTFRTCPPVSLIRGHSRSLPTHPPISVPSPISSKIQPRKWAALRLWWQKMTWSRSKWRLAGITVASCLASLSWESPEPTGSTPFSVWLTGKSLR